MKPREGDVVRCSKCSRPRMVGSRCWQCWLRRLARLHKVACYQWWKQHYPRIQGMLLARFTLAQMGAETTPPEQFIRTIWNTDPRPKWVSHKQNSDSETHTRVLKIIAAVEARAKGEQT